MASHLLAVLTVEHSQYKDIDERDEECRVCVELLLFHEHICSVTKVEIAHDDAHPAEGLEGRLRTQGDGCSRWLLLLEALHVWGHRSAVAVVAKKVEDHEDERRAQEETRRKLLEEVWVR